MKKYIAVLLSIVLLLFVVAGCASDAETDTEDTTTSEAATTDEDTTDEDTTDEDTTDEDTTDEDGYDLTGCEPLEVVIALAGSASDIATIYTEEWMDTVTERTDGLVTFDYTNGGALGSFAELLAGVNSGAYDMTVTDLSLLNEYAPETIMPCLPFIMSGYDQLKAVYSGEVFTWLQECVEEQTGMVLLNSNFCGFREILSKDQLTGLDDFDGYLIRSPQTETFTDMFEILGFSYVTIAWSEAYTAMQTGVIDAVETSLIAHYNTGFYELGKYLVLTNHMQAVNPLVGNQDFWYGMPDVYREIMTDAMEETQQAEWDECVSNEEYYIGLLEDEGVTVTEISDADREEIKEAFMSYWTEKAEEIGGDCPDMLETILSLG